MEIEIEIMEIEVSERRYENAVLIGTALFDAAPSSGQFLLEPEFDKENAYAVLDCVYTPYAGMYRPRIYIRKFGPVAQFLRKES